jgi:hypothetical protein
VPMPREHDPVFRSELPDLDAEFRDLLRGELKLAPPAKSALERSLRRVRHGEGQATATDFQSALPGPMDPRNTNE